MLKVGVWIPLPKGSHWQGEGIARTIEFIVKGMQDEGLLDSDLMICVYTNHWMKDSMTRSFRELLGDGADQVKFSFLTKSSLPSFLEGVTDALADIFYARPVLIDKKLEFFDDDVTKKDFKRYQGSAASVEYGRPVVWPYLTRRLGSKFFLGRWLLKRRLNKFCEKHAVTHKELARNRRRVTSSRNKDKKMRVFYSYSNRELFLFRIEELVNRIPLIGRRLVNRFVGRADEKSFQKSLWQHSIKKSGDVSDEVDVWWVPSPIVRGVELLAKPKLVNFFDFFVGQYGYYWGDAQVREIYFRLNLIMRRATKVITQSRINKYEKIIAPFDVPPTSVAVCHVAAPDHYPKYVTKFAASGLKSPESLKQAADIVRREMFFRAQSSNRHEEYARVGGKTEELVDFDFESRKYILVSTQDRPYKNLKFFVDLIPKIVNKFDDEVYFFFTAAMDFRNKQDPLVKRILKSRMIDRVYSVPRLPNRVHAALYHCATMTLHPSLAEGGAGSYPFMEGMAMGTPGLTGSGDHTREGKLLHPDYDRVVFAANDKQDALSKTLNILKHPEQAYREQKEIYEAHSVWTWRKSAVVYRDALYKTFDEASSPKALLEREILEPQFEDFGDFSGRKIATALKK